MVKRSSMYVLYITALKEQSIEERSEAYTHSDSTFFKVKKLAEIAKNDAIDDENMGPGFWERPIYLDSDLQKVFTLSLRSGDIPVVLMQTKRKLQKSKNF